ncbi:MAG TPA: hypothetical protein VK511_07455 [Gemmatimonadaceae bacterium]|nr:hypothetical protein [Gemmatimonadaceae bacterium]
MTTRWVVILLAFLLFQVSNFAGLQCVALMTDQLNRERRGGKFLWPFGASARIQHLEVVRDYRTLHPEGKLYQRLVLAYIGGAISIAVVAAVLI